MFQRTTRRLGPRRPTRSTRPSVALDPVAIVLNSPVLARADVRTHTRR